MNTVQVKWGLAGVVLLAAFLLYPRAAGPVAVGSLLVAWLLWQSSPSRTSRLPAGETRQVVTTPSTTVAALLALLGFGAGGMGLPLGTFVCFAIAAVGVLDLVVAQIATRRGSATLTAERTDILVGDTVRAHLVLTGPKLPVVVTLGPSPAMGLEPADRETMGLQPNVRLVVDALPVEVRSTGLCGLLGFARRWPVQLPTPVSVGPRPVVPEHRLHLGTRWGDGGHRPSPMGDVVRGVRDYVPGDRRSQVHWKASARTGRLVVKEVEEPVAPALALLLDLGPGGPAGEEAAGRAAWYMNDALQRGAGVVLATCEPGAQLSAPVRSPVEVIRRLARATVGPPPKPDVPPGGRLLRVSPRGDTWS